MSKINKGVEIGKKSVDKISEGWKRYNEYLERQKKKDIERKKIELEHLKLKADIAQQKARINKHKGKSELSWDIFE